MNEMDDLRQERLFDSLLSESERWRVTPSAQWRRATEDETVATDAALAAALHDVRPPREEAEFARARIARRLDELMRAEPTGPVIPRPQDARARMRARLRAVTAPPAAWSAAVARRSAGPTRRRVATRPGYAARGRVWLRHLAPLAAAILLVAFAALAGASAASAQALPESPLYSVKRVEETALLAISWGDESKGQTLAMIANHRLGEATTEASQSRTREAHTLLGEFDVAFGQLIDLTAQAKAKHEDTTTFARAIQVTLESEQNDAALAAAHGDHSFAAAANASAQAATAHIHAAGVTLPTQPGNGNGNGNDHGNGNGNGNGNSNGNGNGNGNGNPQQTPGPQATHTPHPNQGVGAGANPTPTLTPARGG
jgi:hypothetical protein